MKRLSTNKSPFISIICVQCASESFPAAKMPAWGCWILCQMSFVVYLSKHILCKNSSYVKVLLQTLLKKNMIIDSVLAVELFSNMLYICIKSSWYFTLTGCWLLPTYLLWYNSWAISWKILRTLFCKYSEKKNLFYDREPWLLYIITFSLLQPTSDVQPHNTSMPVVILFIWSTLNRIYGWELSHLNHSSPLEFTMDFLDNSKC